MMQWLLKLLGVDPVGKIIDGLNAAHSARLQAKNDSERINADMTIARYETLLEDRRIAADVIKTGMQHRIFWVVWSIAAIPSAAWFGWGMTDSLFNGSLPDVAALPPQLKQYADVVFQNIFYVGAGAAGLEMISKAIRK